MSTIFSDFSTTATKVAPQAQTSVPVQTPQSVSVKEAIPASTVANDTVEISNKKEKKGLIKSVKGFIANVKKFFAAAGEYTKGTVKGIATGAIAGSVVYTGGTAFNAIRQGLADRSAQKAGEEVAKVVKKFPSKVAAGIIAVGALAANLWTASLNATEKQSEIDMRWTGVEQKK